jgi:hypothetical protein
MSTPTPRTDAVVVFPSCNDSSDTSHPQGTHVDADFVRELERELAAEREKVRALRLACERIVAQWDKDHDANPISAGGRMYSWASKVLAATEDAQ